MRGEKRFETVDALVEQMRRDLVEAEKIARRKRPARPAARG
jgi:FAD synthase